MRVQLLTTKNGIPVEFVFMPGSASDVRALNALPLNLPPGSEVYSDAAYRDYHAEDDLCDSSEIELKVMRKKTPNVRMSRGISISSSVLDKTKETVFSSITCVFPKSIHAVTYKGFLLKLEAFIFAFSLKQAFV